MVKPAQNTSIFFNVKHYFNGKQEGSEMLVKINDYHLSCCEFKAQLAGN